MLTSSRASTAASPSRYFLVTWLAEAAIPAPGSMLGWVLGEAGSWTVVCTRSPSAGRPGYAATSSTLEGADLSGIRADAARTPGISLYRGCRDSAADSATSSSCGGGGPRRRDSSRFRTTSAREVQLVLGAGAAAVDDVEDQSQRSADRYCRTASTRRLSSPVTGRSR